MSNTSIAHQKITTDTNEFNYYGTDSKGKFVIKKLYLYPFIDMFNSDIISFYIRKTPSEISILSAKKESIEVASDYTRISFYSYKG